MTIDRRFKAGGPLPPVVVRAVRMELVICCPGSLSVSPANYHWRRPTRYRPKTIPTRKLFAAALHEYLH